MHTNVVSFPWWSVLPFIGLLSIAILPLVAGRWWEDHKHNACVGSAFSIPIVFVILQNATAELGRTLHEYLAFIALLGSLFIVSGGIILDGDLRGTPMVNTIFLAIGAVLANLIGTTGASRTLIRPFLRTNKERRHTTHLSIFFIFAVSNIGGCLTPLGDPPLFLGFLRGVPFGWTLSLWPERLFTVGVLLAIVCVFDTYWWQRESTAAVRADRAHVEPLRLRGRRNLLCLSGILAAIFLPEPWRELVMIAMAGAGLSLDAPGLPTEERLHLSADRRGVEGTDAQLLRLHGLFGRDPPAALPRRDADLLSLALSHITVDFRRTAVL